MLEKRKTLGRRDAENIGNKPEKIGEIPLSFSEKICYYNKYDNYNNRKGEEEAMKFRYISDSHMHTDCSFDGKDPAMMMCERAAKLGFYSVTVTDHCECNEYLQKGFDTAVRQSWFESRKAAAVFRGRIHVLAGVELGQPLQAEAHAQEVLDSYGFDFVLGSLHNIEGEQDFYFLDYHTICLTDYLSRYFDEILAMIEWGKFDSLAHLTYPLRYALQMGVEIPKEYVLQRSEEVLKKLIERGIGLELNTSKMKLIKEGKLPDVEILKRYYELGGRYITVGSDAHRWADIGFGVETGLEILQKIGYRHFTVFVKREPKMVPID